MFFISVLTYVFWGEGKGGGGVRASQFLKAPFRGVMPFLISLEGVKRFVVLCDGSYQPTPGLNNEWSLSTT